MSLSNPRGQSPVKKYFRVNASVGNVNHYDKSVGKEIQVNLPYRFIVLDVLNSVGGFHEPSNSGIWSGEFRNSNTDIVKVRTKNGVLAEGTYSDLKENLKAKGGKFANSVYIAYQEDDQWALGNIKFIGASVSAWFDFGQGRSFDSDPGVVITGFEERKKGRTDYFVPVFDRWTIGGDDLSAASDLDRELQAHLDNSPRVEAEEPVNTPPVQQSFADDFESEPPF